MKNIIRKWYAKLGFPKGWDSAFETLLGKTELSPCTVDDYDHNADFARNLPMYLYFCEHLQKQYKQRGIEEKYLLDTLGDIVIWAKTHYGMHQSLGISETNSGIFINDIIVGIDNHPVTNYDTLYNALDTHKPGDVVQVKILRKGEPRTVPVELTVLQ